jgi:L-ribulose-5-phosphate 3-epimerase
MLGAIPSTKFTGNHLKKVANVYDFCRERAMVNDSLPAVISRRALLLGAAASSTLHALALNEDEKLKICVFSKHFQWTNVQEAASIARDIGFDGVDLTVRSGGHVLPERVQADLPKAVETVRKAGLEVPMITTEITSVTTPHAAEILSTASKLGIHHYRWGGLTYDAHQDIADQLNQLKPQMKMLADLNQEHRVCGMYHTHSGPGMIGGPIWDLWTMFQTLNPQWIGVNYDIGHATVEGGYGGWIASSRLVKNSMRGIALKDFSWGRNEKSSTHQDPYDKSLGIEGAWVPHWCAMGQGMVNFAGFFAIVKQNRFSGPVQLHFEYPGLGGAENGDKTLRIPKPELISAMRRDLTYTRGVMRNSQLI